jgi:hypothetical protein
MKNLIALLALTLVSLQSHADIKADVELLRSLAPEGSDVAMIQTEILRGSTEDEALKSAEGNYLIKDIDGDGVSDILVIFEKNPTLINDDGKACPKEDWQAGCRITYGDRVVQFWKGQGNGQLFNKVSENSKIVMRADDGGIFGEPLQGFSVSKKGSISLNFYGGSAWRWSVNYTLQFRTNDLYFIGYDTSYGWNGDGRFEATSINYLTGKVVKSSSKGENARVHYKTSRLAKQPLLALSKIAPIETEE